MYNLIGLWLFLALVALFLFVIIVLFLIGVPQELRKIAFYLEKIYKDRENIP